MNKCYVYNLIDPRSGEIFYIGKGCGRRCFFHKSEAIRGVSANPLKAQIIRDILASNLEIKIEQKFFELESDALKFEKYQIAAHKPRGNIIGGVVKKVTFYGLLAEMMTTWKDRKDEMQRLFPRHLIPQGYHALYDAVMSSPKIGN